MEKEFVPYDRALRLKALGFDEPCFGFYDDGHLNLVNVRNGNMFKTNNGCLVPIFSQAFRWFRDKGYDVSFRKYDYGDESVFTGYYYTIYIGNETIDLHGADKRSKTYEGCELACLDKLLEIVEKTEK